MKRLLLLMLMVGLLFGSSVTAEDSMVLDIGEQFKFAWTANTEPDLAGYRIYISSQSGQYTFGEANAYTTVGVMAEPTSGPHTISAVGTYYFVVTAFDAGGNESGPSNEIYAVIEDRPPKPPAGCAIFKF